MDMYTQMKWLNAFAVINELAMQKILKKFIKEHFEIKDNLIDKNLTEFIKSKDFANRSTLHYAIDDMFTFFAMHFTGNNKLKSKRMLESVGAEMRRKDAILISFFGGASSIMVLLALFFMFTDSSDGQDDYEVIVSGLAPIRFTFILIYILFACGFAIQVFQAYGVNYLYIFELDPHEKIMSEQFYRLGVILLFMWSSCFALSIMELRLDYLFKDAPAYFMVVLLAFFLFYCLQPCLKCGYRTARFQLLITLKEIMTSPFGRVRFRDFFFADIITSMVSSLQDIGIIFVYLLKYDFESETAPDKKAMPL
jgi:hypothetical protein